MQTTSQTHAVSGNFHASLGIDIGGTSAKLLLRGADGTERRIATATYSRPTLEELSATVRSGLEEIGLAGMAQLRVGCCVPGKFTIGPSGEADTVAYSANLPCLNGVAMKSFVPELLGCNAHAVSILPDSIATALGSHSAMPVPGRLLCVALGTGVGAALLIDGSPVTLAPGSVGHFGQIDVSLDDHAPIGTDGGRGSLEAYIGLPALRQRFGDSRQAVQSGIQSMSPDDPALCALARAVRIAHAIYTPDEIRLLGGLGTLLASHTDSLVRLVNDSLTEVANSGWALRTGDDPFYAASGAAAFAGSASG